MHVNSVDGSEYFVSANSFHCFATSLVRWRCHVSDFRCQPEWSDTSTSQLAEMLEMTYWLVCLLSRLISTSSQKLRKKVNTLEGAEALRQEELLW